MGKEEQGILSSRYSVIPRVLIFIFNEEEYEVVLIRGTKNKKLWAGKYNGIGGHIEKGEDVQSAAIRELHEETGIQDGDLCLCGTVHVDVDDKTGVLLFVFKCIYKGGSLHESLEGVPEWVNISQIQDITTVTDVPVLLDHCLHWHSGNPLFHLHSFYKNDELIVEDHQAFNS